MAGLQISGLNTKKIEMNLQERHCLVALISYLNTSDGFTIENYLKLIIGLHNTDIENFLNANV